MQTDRPRVLVIANPISGRGRAERGARALVAALEAQGTLAELAFTAGPGDASRIAGELSADTGSVVSVGGDGTLRDVVHGLRDLSVKVGMLPTGTANILAKELHLPRDPVGAANMVAAGDSVPFDLAEANGRRFLLVAGVGFDAACAKAVNHGRKGTITMASYVLPVARTLFAFRHPELRVTFEDGTMIEEAIAVVVSNVRGYGGPFEIASYAHHASGLLDVVTLAGRWPLPRLATLMAGGLLRLAPLVPGVTYRQVRELTVEAPHPVPCQLDGDYAGETPLTFRLLQERVRILAPNLLSRLGLVRSTAAR